MPFQGLILIGQVVPKLRPFICQPMTGHSAMTSQLTSQFLFFFFFARTATHVRARTYGHARTGTHVTAPTSPSIIPAISLCVCVWPLFLDNHCSDLIETCQVYCWGPEYVHFQGLILIGQVVPKLWPFIYQTNDRTRWYDVTMTSQSFFFFFLFLHIWPRRYGPVQVLQNGGVTFNPV